MKTDDLIDKMEKENPCHYLRETEFVNSLLKFGALISIIKNKKINQTSLTALLLDDRKIRDIFEKLTEIDNFNIIIRKILRHYPNLSRSKIIKIKYKKYIKAYDRQRKNNLQRVSSYFQETE